MKHDYKKHEKELYGPCGQPAILTVPAQKYIMLQGRGNPNDADFSQRVGVLYSLAHPIKMRHKVFCNQNPQRISTFAYPEYAIFPLEGLWSSESQNLQDKDKFIYTIMIRQPDFITHDMYEDALRTVKKKKPHPLLAEVTFDTVEDGLSMQALHSGSFDDEMRTFARMDAYAEQNGYRRTGHVHREIYLNDARKTPPEKRRTILRYPVQKDAVQ